MTKNTNGISPLIGIAALGLGLSSPAAAQVDPGTAKAETITPSTLSKLRDLQFGTIVPGTSPSVVRVNPFTGARNVVSGDAQGFGGTVTTGRFEVDARPLLFYQIVVPVNPVPITSGSNSMAVTNFTLNGPGIRLLPLFTRIGRFDVGGDLNVGANQPKGSYTGDFIMTVNYF